MSSTYNVSERSVTSSEIVKSDVDIHTQIVSLFILRLIKNKYVKDFWCYMRPTGFRHVEITANFTTTQDFTYTYSIQTKIEPSTYDRDYLPLPTQWRSEHIYEIIESLPDGIVMKNGDRSKWDNGQWKDNSFVLYISCKNEEGIEVDCDPEVSSDLFCDLLNIEGGIICPIGQPIEKHCKLCLFMNQGDAKYIRDEMRVILYNLIQPIIVTPEQANRICDEISTLVERWSKDVLINTLLLSKNWILNAICEVILKQHMWRFEFEEGDGDLNFNFLNNFAKKSKMIVEDDALVREYLKNCISRYVLNQIEYTMASANKVYQYLFWIERAPIILQINDMVISVQVMEFLQRFCGIKAIFLVRHEWIGRLSQFTSTCSTLKDLDEDFKAEVLNSPIQRKGKSFSVCELINDKMSDLLEIKEIIGILSQSLRDGNNFRGNLENTKKTPVGNNTEIKK